MNMEVENEAKRKRDDAGFEIQPRDKHTEPLQLEPQRDCFSETLEGYPMHQDGTVRNSWLVHGEWLTRASVAARAASEKNNLTTKDQIKSLQLQLCQIKRRFESATAKCAKACNSQPHIEFEEARRMCNPFEDLAETRSFMNRAAVKLANVDAMLEFSLTQCDGLFLFCDLCGAPGGFSEYLMRRCQSNGHSSLGYGMSLVGSNEHGHGAKWKLRHMMRDDGGLFTQYRICKGRDGTGDIYLWDNVEALQNDIVTDPSLDGYINKSERQVHLVVADGGFDAQRDSECQEELAQKIVVCQASAALAILRKNGSLVLKMFGFQTSVVRTLMKAMFRLFDKIKVLKPISSRPASAERYVVFAGYKGAPPGFDGCAWRNKIFLGESERQTTCPDKEEKVESAFCERLDEADRDILQLNVKACFQILSYLDGKRHAIENGGDGNQLYTRSKPPVNVMTYKLAWQLV